MSESIEGTVARSGFSMYKAMLTRTERFPLTREINRVELAAPSGFQESGSPE